MSNIIAIEMRRIGLSLSRGQLCRTARIARSTYNRLLRRPGSGNVGTLARLGAALDAHAQLATPPASPPSAAAPKETAHV